MKRPVGMLTARGQVYKQLSIGFLYPDQKFLASLRSGSFVKALSEAARNLPRYYSLASQVTKIHKAIHESEHQITDSEYEIGYTRLFAHGNPIVAPPYETDYGTEHIFAKTRELADVAAFYKAFGLKTSDQLKEMPDHVGTELEFMYILLTKETYAVFNNWKERAVICRDAERKFLVDHLGRWVPSLCRLVREAANLAYYPALAGVLAHFILAECKMRNVKIELRNDLIPKLDEQKDFVCPMTGCVARESEVDP